MQRELIPDAGSWTCCHVCGRKLSRNPRLNRTTRLYGLCWRHLRQWKRSSGWSVERFVRFCRTKQKQE